MISSRNAFKKTKECLIDGEEILLFSCQLKPWRFIDKFWVVFFLICMIFNFLYGIIMIIINPTIYGIGTSLIYFVVFILLLFIYIYFKPLKKLSIKYPKSFYAFTNYRIIYIKPNIFFGNKMYYYDFISDVSMNIYPVKKRLDYQYVISFMHDANSNYENGVTSLYKIYLKTKEEVDQISKIISEHPTKEEKEKYYQILQSPKSLKNMIIRHFSESIITSLVFYFMYGKNDKSSILYSLYIFIGFFSISMFAEWFVIYNSKKENNN